MLVAHERWFDRSPYNNGAPRLAWEHDRDWRCGIWAYPQATADEHRRYQWHLPRFSMSQPRAAALLGLLWKSELLEEAARHRVSVTSRARCQDIIDLMAWMMTGREIAQAVCRQLRARSFPEADAPIFEQFEVAV